MKVKCPRCQKFGPWEGNEFRPFCSERCKVRDLGRWAVEDYKVPCAEDDEISEEDSAAIKDEQGKGDEE